MWICASKCRHLLTTLFQTHPNLIYEQYISKQDAYCRDCDGTANAGAWLLCKAATLIPKEIQTAEHNYFQTGRVNADVVVEELCLAKAPYPQYILLPLDSDPACDLAAEAWQMACLLNRLSGTSGAEAPSTAPQTGHGPGDATQQQSNPPRADNFGYIAASLRQHQQHGWLQGNGHGTRG